MKILPWLITLFSASRLIAAGDAHIHHGSTMNHEQAELGASAVFDRAGGLWAVHKVDGRIAVNRSRDCGRSWSAPTWVTAGPEETDGGGDARPKIAVGPEGEVYVTWTRPLKQPYTGQIMFSRSSDGGQTFAPPFVVHHDSQEITHRFDALAVTPRGDVFVAWIDKRDLVATGKSDSYRGAAVYFAVSHDRGATFQGDFKVADHTCECCRIALASDANGDVLALWRHVFEPNVRDHALATLHADGTVSHFRRATFDDWRLDGCPHHGPGLARDGHGGLHAVWFTAAAGQGGVYYGQLREDGVDHMRPVGGKGAEHADIAVTGNRVVVAWREYRDDRMHLRALISDDTGATWREQDLASTTGPSDHPRVLTFGDRCFVFWNTQEQPLRMVQLP